MPPQWPRSRSSDWLVSSKAVDAASFLFFSFFFFFPFWDGSHRDSFSVPFNKTLIVFWPTQCSCCNMSPRLFVTGSFLFDCLFLSYGSCAMYSVSWPVIVAIDINLVVKAGERFSFSLVSNLYLGLCSCELLTCQFYFICKVFIIVLNTYFHDKNARSRLGTYEKGLAMYAAWDVASFYVMHVLKERRL